MTNPVDLGSFGGRINAAVIGASGGIGAAVARQLDSCPTVEKVIRLSRAQKSAAHTLDLEHETTVADAAAAIMESVGPLHLVFVATGMLHDGDGVKPEKTWRSLSARAFDKAFRVNATGPALIAKHFLPLLASDRKSAFAALSARVGSIDDNRLGGWHAYRASKAALNMIIKTLSIELSRRNPHALCVGLHPGTVDTPLSKPFQSGLPANALFDPEHSARALLAVLDQLTPEDSGNLFAWDGARIPF